MPHLVILIPGIMGSVLQRNGRDLWSLSGQALGEFFLSAGSMLNNLDLREDDLARDQLPDGIVATRLIEQVHTIPKLIKGAGYATMHQVLCQAFNLTPGNIHNPHPHENFFPFPYDWRRDIRVAARQLQAFIAQQLPAWRAQSGARQARVVLIAHSLGGLVARQYVEVLGGAPDVELLYTLGTPHRGSLNALDVISNGLTLHTGLLELPLHDLTRVVRSFTSIYQLLPIYPVLERDHQFLRVAEAGPLPHVDPARATQARAVLIQIADTARANRQSGRIPSGKTIPVIGIRQATAQRAYLTDTGAIALSTHPLPGASVADGDGTVPHFSAIPTEVQELQLATERFVVEHHGWLANGEASLRGLMADLAYRLDRNHYPTYTEPGQQQDGIGVHVEDLYAANEPITISAQFYGTDTSIALAAQLTHVGTPTTQRINLTAAGATHSATIPVLPPGLYQLTVGPQRSATKTLGTVTTAFEVVAG